MPTSPLTRRRTGWSISRTRPPPRYIGQVLTNLDRPKPQVLIKVVFLEVTRNDASDIGIEGSFNKNLGNSWSSGLVTNFAVVSNTIVPTSIIPGPSSSLRVHAPIFSACLEPLPAFSGANGLYQILGQDYPVTLHAIAQAGKAKVLSRPSILARNNQPATITVGQEVPLITGVTYDSLGNSHNAYHLYECRRHFEGHPFHHRGWLVEMMVSPQISQIDPTLSIPISASANGTTISAPVIDIRSADTVAVTPDGQTVVIGGLMQTPRRKPSPRYRCWAISPCWAICSSGTQKSDPRANSSSS